MDGRERWESQSRDQPAVDDEVRAGDDCDLVAQMHIHGASLLLTFIQSRSASESITAA